MFSLRQTYVDVHGNKHFRHDFGTQIIEAYMNHDNIKRGHYDEECTDVVEIARIGNYAADEIKEAIKAFIKDIFQREWISSPSSLLPPAFYLTPQIGIEELEELDEKCFTLAEWTQNSKIETDTIEKAILTTASKITDHYRKIGYDLIMQRYQGQYVEPMIQLQTTSASQVNALVAGTYSSNCNV